MKITVFHLPTVGRHGIRIEKESTDQKFYNDSTLLHHIKIELSKKLKAVDHPSKGDLIKKLMWKDGHMVDDHQHYIRSRKPYKLKSTGEKGYLMVWDSDYQIRLLHQVFNEGQCFLMMED